MMTKSTSVLALLISLALLTFVGCGDDDDAGTPKTATSAAAVPSASPTALTSATPTVPSTPGEPRVQITGLFNGEPPAGTQPTAVVQSLGSRPDSSFAPWNGQSAVIYDTKTGAQTDVGNVSQVLFSPDSTLAAWIAGRSTAPATVMNLSTGSLRTYAEGTNVGFLDNERLAIHDAATSAWKVFDVTTGQLSSDQSLGPDQSQPGYPSYPPSPLGYYWQVTPDNTTALPRGGAGKNNFRLVSTSSGDMALRFDAVFATSGGPNEIVLGTPLEGVTTNIFVVNIQTGKAEFIARTRYGQGPNWPLSATARYVLWTDNFCWSDGVDQQGRVQLYDRTTKTLTEIDDSGTISGPSEERFVKLTPSDSIAWGSFGATALVDAVSLNYLTVLPQLTAASARNWSPDYRYASYALGGGHGGLC